MARVPPLWAIRHPDHRRVVAVYKTHGSVDTRNWTVWGAGTLRSGQSFSDFLKDFKHGKGRLDNWRGMDSGAQDTASDNLGHRSPSEPPSTAPPSGGPPAGGPPSGGSSGSSSGGPGGSSSGGTSGSPGSGDDSNPGNDDTLHELQGLLDQVDQDLDTIDDGLDQLGDGIDDANDQAADANSAADDLDNAASGVADVVSRLEDLDLDLDSDLADLDSTGDLDPGGFGPGSPPDDLVLPASGGDPVRLFSGALIRREFDIQAACRGFPFALERIYLSTAFITGLLGPRWRLSVEDQLRTLRSGKILRTTGDASTVVYTPDPASAGRPGGDRWLGPSGRPEVLETTPSGHRVRDGEGVEHHFDTHGDLIRVQDRFGNTLRIQRQDRRIVAVFDPNGRKYVFVYGPGGLLTSITAPDGGVVTYGYREGRLSSVSHPGPAPGVAGPAFSYTYRDGSDPRSRHLLVKVQDAEGRRLLTVTYGSSGADSGRVVEQEMHAGTIRLRYRPGTGEVYQVTRITDRVGVATDHSFSRGGRLLSRAVQTDDGTVETRFRYSRDGLVATVEHPGGALTEYSYDEGSDPLARGNLLEVTERASANAPAADTRSERYTYGVFNQRTSRVDPLGETTTFVLDSLGRTTEMLEPPIHVLGQGNVVPTTRWAYAADGNPTRQQDPSGLVTRFTYYASGPRKGLLRKFESDDGRLTTTQAWQLDDRGQVVRQIDPGDDVLDTRRDDRGRVVEIRRNGRLLQKTIWDRYDRATTVRHRRLEPDGTPSTPEWVDVHLRYDEHFRVIETQTAVGATILESIGYRYDAEDRVVVVVGPDGSEEQRDYDELGRLVRSRIAAGTSAEASSRLTYDLAGNLIETIDPNGNVFEESWDGLGRPIGSRGPDGSSETVTWPRGGTLRRVDRLDPAGALVARVEIEALPAEGAVRRRAARLAADGSVAGWVEERQHFDAAGNVIAFIGPQGETSHVTYDAFGREVRRVDALGNRLETTFDANGRPLEVVRHEVLANGGSARFRITHRYDKEGRLLGWSDSAGRQQSMVWDGGGRLRTVTRHTGAEESYEYDALGRVVAAGTTTERDCFVWGRGGHLEAVIDADGGRTEFEQDAQGRVTRIRDAAGVVRHRHRYDAVGNLVESSDARGFTIRQTFDALRRVVRRTITGPAGAVGASDERFEYDALGNVTKAVSNAGVVEQRFDSLSLLTTSTVGGHTVRRGYDGGGAHASLRYSCGLELGFERDAVTRLTRVSAKLDANHAFPGSAVPATLARYRWQGRELRHGLSTGDGVEAQWRHDVLGRPMQLQVEHRGTALHSEFQLKNADDRVVVRGSGDGSATRYGHDIQGRLVSVQEATFQAATPGGGLDAALAVQQLGTEGSQTGLDTLASSFSPRGNEEAFAYSPGGARSEHRAGAGTTLSPSNALHQPTQVGATTLSWDAAGHLRDDGVLTYAYDYAGRLCRVQDKASSSVVLSVGYDALGRPLTVDEGPGPRTILYDDDRPLEVVRPDGTVESAFVWGAGPDELLAVADGGTMGFALPNLHGDVGLITDGRGGLRESYRYGLFGDREVLEPSGNVSTASAASPFGYLGRPHRAGLVDLRARHLHPSLGLFMTPDPSGFSDGTNPYVYAGHDPLSAGDREGLRFVIIGGALGLAWGSLWALGSMVKGPWKGVGHYASQVAQFTLGGAMFGLTLDLGPAAGGLPGLIAGGASVSALGAASKGDWGEFGWSIAKGAAFGYAVWGALKIGGKVLGPVGRWIGGTALGGAVVAGLRGAGAWIAGSRVGLAVSGAAGRAGARASELIGSRLFQRHTLEVAVGEGNIPLLPMHLGFRSNGVWLHAGGTKPLSHVFTHGRSQWKAALGTSQVITVHGSQARYLPTVFRLPAINPSLAGNLAGKEVWSCITSTWNAWSRANYHLPNLGLGTYFGSRFFGGSKQPASPALRKPRGGADPRFHKKDC